MSWNWKRSVEDDLRLHESRKEALTNIREKYNILKEESTAVKTSNLSAAPTSGGMSRTEEKIIANQAERDKLAAAYKSTLKRIRLIERGLEQLTPVQRTCLDRFYIHSARGNIDKLCQELGYERSRVYQIRDEALYRLTIALHGETET